MGITGLIPLLNSIHAKVHIREYKGQAVAVDGYVWLHRGTFSCAQDIAMGKYTSRYVCQYEKPRRIPTDRQAKCRYVTYFMHYVNMLKFHGIDPIIVFDGAKLPSKRHTEEDRHSYAFASFSVARLDLATILTVEYLPYRRREENRAKGLEYLRTGEQKKAFECFQKCVDVTPEMAYQVIKVCLPSV